MHPVQAAPRQRSWIGVYAARFLGGPRAGSAEAKELDRGLRPSLFRCTPCRQRRGKVGRRICTGRAKLMHPVQAAPRQRGRCRTAEASRMMHPVQAAPRQSKGRGNANDPHSTMHPVQAAPRQRLPPLPPSEFAQMHPVQAAPRQSPRFSSVYRRTPDAPRAGSAEAKHASFPFFRGFL